jgi:hypothetical protein
MWTAGRDGRLMCSRLKLIGVNQTLALLEVHPLKIWVIPKGHLRVARDGPPPVSG